MTRAFAVASPMFRASLELQSDQPGVYAYVFKVNPLGA